MCLDMYVYSLVIVMIIKLYIHIYIYIHIDVFFVYLCFVLLHFLGVGRCWMMLVDFEPSKKNKAAGSQQECGTPD